MSERRQDQRILPPIKKSTSKGEDKDLEVSTHRESTNIAESFPKMKPDGRSHQPVAASIGLEESFGKLIPHRHSFQRQESLPGSILPGHQQRVSRIRSEDQRLFAHAQGASFPNLSFRLGIASEYDLNSPSGMAKSNQKCTQLFRSKQLGGNLPLSGVNYNEFNPSRKNGYLRDDVVVSDTAARQPAEDLSPRCLYEMQLRYNNLVKLDSHIRFKNSQVLRGERIRKPHTLPGIRAQLDSNSLNEDVNGNLELLAVLSVKQANETGKERGCVKRFCSNTSEDSVAPSRLHLSYQDTIDSQEAGDRRSGFYKNRKKLNQRKIFSERKQRGEALHNDNEQVLITQALRLGTAQCTKSKTSWREFQGSYAAPLTNKVEWDVPRPSAMVTISGGCGSALHKSINITLPDCKLKGSPADCSLNPVLSPSSDNVFSNNGITQFDFNEDNSIQMDKSRDSRQSSNKSKTAKSQEELALNLARVDTNGLSVAHENDVFTDDSFSEVLIETEFPEDPHITETDVLLDDGESDTDEEVKQAMGAIAVDIKCPDWIPSSPGSIEAQCTGSRPSTRSVIVKDLLAVPESNVTRCVEVLSLGSVGGTGAFDIPEIRMICATPLPPGSPDI